MNEKLRTDTPVNTDRVLGFTFTCNPRPNAAWAGAGVKNFTDAAPLAAATLPTSVARDASPEPNKLATDLPNSVAAVPIASNIPPPRFNTFSPLAAAIPRPT